VTSTAAARAATPPPHAVVLDVGHGNATVIIDDDRAIVVDAGHGDLVVDTLERHGISVIESLVVSHRHHDHTSEIPSLLANRDLCVRKLFVNADPTRNPSSAFERSLRAGFNDSKTRNKTELHQANETLGHYIQTQRLVVEVLTPNSDMTLTGVGATTPTGAEVNPHALAVVLRISVEGGRSMLLGADLDHAGFVRLMDDDAKELEADLLIYPHHGGLSAAGDEEAFAAALTAAVAPEIVLFSNGRGGYQTPRREVVRGVRSNTKKVRVVCTQLHESCSAASYPANGRLDDTLSSRGSTAGHSCAGSVRVSFAADAQLLPLGSRHMDFVVNTIGPSAMCSTEPSA
jgi:beta-lactamase superfamily II metal-dependent hydrolase